MTVDELLRNKLRKGTLHMTLIDPAKQEPSQAGSIVKEACRLGTDAIMVGGSTDVTQQNLDETVLAIRPTSMFRSSTSPRAPTLYRRMPMPSTL